MESMEKMKISSVQTGRENGPNILAVTTFKEYHLTPIKMATTKKI